MIPVRDSIGSNKKAFLTTGLVVINVAAFLYQLAGPHSFQEFINQWGVIPIRFDRGAISASEMQKVLVSMFLHASPLHLIGNMWFLYVFGKGLETRLGIIRYLMLYLGCGVLATIIQIMTDPSSTIPLIGASGAIAGVLGAYFRGFRKAKILTALPLLIMFKMIWFPAWLYIGLWVAFQVVLAMITNKAHYQIAYGAHIGGFVAGVLLMSILIRSKPSKKKGLMKRLKRKK